MSCAYFNWDFRHHPLRWLIVIPLVVSNFGMYHCITVSQSQHTSGSGRLLTFTQSFSEKLRILRMRMQMVNYSWVNLLSWSVRWDPRCQMRSVLWKWRVEFGYPSSKAPPKTGCVYGSVTTGCVTKVLNISRKTNWLLNFQWNLFPIWTERWLRWLR